MIKLENTEVYGWEAAIRGMRNPMNSWDKSDTLFDGDMFCMGDNDLNLMKRLAKAGSDHRKFLRMITVTVDVTAPLYWWKEFDTYKVGTVTNSCSTMHKIHAKEFTLDDFSHEHLYSSTMFTLKNMVYKLNFWREKYLDTKNKDDWWQLIQLLPSSYNQRRTCCLNYEVLANIYFARRNHKLDEWHAFCDWILSLPYFKEIMEV
uniref:Uncharacterized protein n=1 Tax=Siphoviridae sp. ctDmR33 TaxID=2825389 RepID=A0A8S5UX70_9CAUD|nr:MAG TPA: hypothetical protein [Siphoviridae sp. ctDmR33]